MTRYIVEARRKESFDLMYCVIDLSRPAVTGVIKEEGGLAFIREPLCECSKRKDADGIVNMLNTGEAYQAVRR